MIPDVIEQHRFEIERRLNAATARAYAIVDGKEETAVSVRLPKSLAAYRLLTRAATPLAQQLLNYRLKHGKEHPTRLPERRGETR